PAERTVLIDRTRERRMRPSIVVEHLRTLQERPPRFRPEAFLEALFSAYRVLAQRHGSGALQRAPVERLMQVYDLLTLLPGQSREYSRQEFARDLYLLDRSGTTATRDGFVVSFPASTGPRCASTLSTVSTTQWHVRWTGMAWPERFWSVCSERAACVYRPPPSRCRRYVWPSSTPRPRCCCEPTCEGRWRTSCSKTTP